MHRINALQPPRVHAWIATIALVGLIVRIAAARGSLWLDEAWSALLAQQAGTPLGVFAQINHDNNHHLNSLWLQLVGPGAPPIIARALSIVTGTLGVFVAGLIGSRRGPLASIVTALLFALSPAMVSLGSEARGYAPMMLMTLIAFWHIDRYLDGDAGGDRPVTIALCFFVGTLAQMTMVFAASALVGWPLLTLWRREGLMTAVRKTGRLLGPALVSMAVALGLVFAPMLMGAAEFRLGSVAAFTLGGFVRGLAALLRYTQGGPALLALILGAIALQRVARADNARLPFYALALIAFPLTVLMLRPMNAEHSRYYLLVGTALLLLLGEALPALLTDGRRSRLAVLCAVGLIGGASLGADASLIRQGRGDVEPAVQTLASRAPRGASVAVARESGLALIEVAAAEAGYPLRIGRDCTRARFVFAEWFDGENPEALAARCGASLRPIASATSHGLSGQNWTLYERLG